MSRAIRKRFSNIRGPKESRTRIFKNNKDYLNINNLYYLMTTNIITQFNNISLEFIKQTEKLTSKQYSIQFKLLMSVNSLLPIEMYTKNILPYKKYIYNKDERFFINMDIDNSYMSYFTDILTLKKIFKGLDKETKNNIWEYIQALTILAEEKYNNISNAPLKY